MKTYTFKEILKELMSTNDVAGYDSKYAFSDKVRDDIVKKFINIYGYKLTKIDREEHVNENVEPSDYDIVKDLIRDELANLMYFLFKKRSF